MSALNAQERLRKAQEAEIQFQQVARLCAARARVQITLKPGEKVDILGTERQQFDFGKCMAENGHPTEGGR